MFPCHKFFNILPWKVACTKFGYPFLHGVHDWYFSHWWWRLYAWWRTLSLEELHTWWNLWRDTLEIEICRGTIRFRGACHAVLVLSNNDERNFYRTAGQIKSTSWIMRVVEECSSQVSTEDQMLGGIYEANTSSMSFVHHCGWHHACGEYLPPKLSPTMHPLVNWALWSFVEVASLCVSQYSYWASAQLPVCSNKWLLHWFIFVTTLEGLGVYRALFLAWPIPLCGTVVGSSKQLLSDLWERQQFFNVLLSGACLPLVCMFSFKEFLMDCHLLTRKILCCVILNH